MRLHSVATQPHPSLALQSEHIAGAISVPMFRETAGDGGWDKVKRVRGLCEGVTRGAEDEREWRAAELCAWPWPRLAMPSPFSQHQPN